jgi:hypothetical protein
MSSAPRALRMCRACRNNLRPTAALRPMISLQSPFTRLPASSPILNHNVGRVSAPLVHSASFASRETEANAGVDDAMEEIEEA